MSEPNKKQPTVREAARGRKPLDGADAQALEGALAATERERDALRMALDERNEMFSESKAEVERLKQARLHDPETFADSLSDAHGLGQERGWRDGAEAAARWIESEYGHRPAIGFDLIEEIRTKVRDQFRRGSVPLWWVRDAEYPEDGAHAYSAATKEEAELRGRAAFNDETVASLVTENDVAKLQEEIEKAESALASEREAHGKTKHDMGVHLGRLRKVSDELRFERQSHEATRQILTRLRGRVEEIWDALNSPNIGRAKDLILEAAQSPLFGMPVQPDHNPALRTPASPPKAKGRCPDEPCIKIAGHDGPHEAVTAPATDDDIRAWAASPPEGETLTTKEQKDDGPGDEESSPSGGREQGARGLAGVRGRPRGDGREDAIRHSQNQGLEERNCSQAEKVAAALTPDEEEALRCADCGKDPGPSEPGLSFRPGTKDWVCIDCGYYKPSPRRWTLEEIEAALKKAHESSEGDADLLVFAFRRSLGLKEGEP